jgi:hypothetical protein
VIAPAVWAAAAIGPATTANNAVTNILRTLYLLNTDTDN